MPTHTPASALIKLFFAMHGAPWIFPRWLEITGLKHPFNPKRDEHIPKDLTRAKINAIESYFSQYHAKPTEDEKIKFAMKLKQDGIETVPGRELWRNWVTSHYSTHWKIHSRIAKILSSQGIHPEQLMAETGDDSPPNSASYLPIVLDDIGRELFGPEALDSNGRLLTKLRDPTLILAQRTWTSQVKNMGPRKLRLEKMLQQAEEKLSNLEAGDITVKSINKAIRAIAAFENACSASQYLSTIESLKERLEPFIPDEPVKPNSGAKTVAKTVKRKKVTKDKLAQSATPEEVTRLLETYDAYFGHSSSVDEELDTEQPQGISFGQPIEGADPGVQVEAGMTTGQLSSRLGLGPGNMPFLFNTVRHSGGFSAWSKEFEEACQSKSDSLERFSLQWHQLCGVHAALRMVLTTTPQPTHCTGVLFADDVGLGKTIQTSAIMAILADLCVLQERNLALPPIALITRVLTLTSQQAMHQDYGQLYTSKRASLSFPWDQNYLTVAIDEAQGLRNPGAKHLSALRILEQASVRLILTATPLQTSTKDITAMGRLTGIPYFFSDESRTDQSAANAQLRRAKIERDQDFEEFTADNDPVKLAQVDISKRLAAKFQNRVIRRVATSLDVDGNPLILLPPIDVIEGILHLTEREREILDEITLSGLGDASNANSRNATSQTFYLEHRMGVTFARADPDEPIPVFKTIKEWEQQMSTKINVLVIVSRYILTRDDMPPVRFENGAPVLSPAPTTLRFTREIKIVIYQEFPLYTALVINIFQLYNIPVLSICGRDSFEQRAKIVQRFNEDPKCRVLIFSKVGSTGLNLTRASFILFLDQPWSAQDVRQISGRVWRQRQRRPVTAIHLLAAETADITLSSLAQGKKNMLDAFLTTDTSKALLSVMTGNVLDDTNDPYQEQLSVVKENVPMDGDDEQGEEQVETAPSKKKRTKKQTKTAESATESKGKGRRKTRKSVPIILDDEENEIDTVDLGEASKTALAGGLHTDPSGDSDVVDTVTDTDTVDPLTDTDHVSTNEKLPDSSIAGLGSLVSYGSSDDEMDDEPFVVPITSQGIEYREGPFSH
ncbi:hypothetical protein EST38_g13204 [Candolleomyces aberdarensis]|uniref:Helicase C-terminal domain-containing protein n=1 Tax=Candolleomyces aberdarensis TaxID=2316362 RepID=A0A4Q2D184_9AGAR|nr:hypothetical protein EST38_g13204 [Candolleomyces aberdarensis]